LGRQSRHRIQVLRAGQAPVALARNLPGAPGPQLRGRPLLSGRPWLGGRSSRRAARFASCVALALAWAPCTATASDAGDALTDQGVAAATATTSQTGEPSLSSPTTDVPTQPDPIQPGPTESPTVPPPADPGAGAPATGQPPPPADPGQPGDSTTGPPGADPPASDPGASDPPADGPPAADPPPSDEPAGGPPPGETPSDAPSDPHPDPGPRAAPSHPADRPPTAPTAVSPGPDPAVAQPPTGDPTPRRRVSERADGSGTSHAGSPAKAEGIATDAINARDPFGESRWLFGSAPSPIGLAAAAGWPATDILVSLAPVPTPRLVDSRAAPEARERAAPTKTDKRRRSWPEAPTGPVQTPKHALVASAAAAGSVAPPALSCAIFAALAGLAGLELRRLRAQLLVPDAPGVPSLRDRPG
jgi:hypothetical protein